MVTATNTSVEPLTLTAISDSVDGDVIDVLGLPAAQTTCDDLAGSSIASGATITCTFVVPVNGNAGDSVTDTVTVAATDGNGHVATDQAGASVAITDVAPALLVSKSTATPTISEPRADVVYDVVVTNSSSELVQLVTLTDQISGGTVRSLLALSGSITQTTCLLPTVLAGGSYSCSFTAHVTGNAGQIVPDVVRVVGVDDDGSRAEASDDATVLITDVLPAISVDKSASPTVVAEPGGPVTYTVVVSNLTAESVTIGSIVDAIGGGAPSAVGGSCAARVGTTLAGHASTTCTFVVAVTADASAGPVTDTVTVTATDDEDHTATAADSATVTITDVLPSITVTKSPLPATIAEPGGMVTFTVGVHNTSVEPVTIDAIVDAVGGGTPVDVASVVGTCDELIGDTLAAGASTTCTFELFVAGNGGTVVDDTVTVSAGDNEGNQATASAAASVTVTDVAPQITVTKTAPIRHRSSNLVARSPTR